MQHQAPAHTHAPQSGDEAQAEDFQQASSLTRQGFVCRWQPHQTCVQTRQQAVSRDVTSAASVDAATGHSEHLYTFLTAQNVYLALICIETL